MTNVLLMLADDMGFGDLFRSPHPAFGAMQKINSRFKTQGTLLQRYLTPSTVCSPSRYGVVTGRDPVVDGVLTLFDETTTHNAIVGILASIPTIYQAMKDAGFTTGQFGKWHLGLDPS